MATAATELASPEELVTPEPPTIRRPRTQNRTTLFAGRLGVLVSILVVWSVLATRSDHVPSIPASVGELIEGFRAGWINDPLFETMGVILRGFVIALALALPFGILIGRSRFLGQVMDPIVTGLFAVPRIVIYPALVTWLGVTSAPKVWMAALSAFFPIVMTTATGIRNVDATLLKLAASLKCSRFQRFRLILLPAAAPSLMVGVRIGFSGSFISVIIAEMVASRLGLGRLIQGAYSLQQLDRMYGVILLVASIALAGNMILWWLERRIRSTTE